MRYFNSRELGGQNFSRGIIVEDYAFEKKASHQTADVFLSHSSKDSAVLPSVIGFLRQYGVNVYIDKSDKELPQKTSPETGSKLKRRIGECRKFIVLVTENSKGSKWIPWEIGLADEMKKLGNVALLPDIDNQLNVDWLDQEYLGLYSRIVNHNFQGKTESEWMVLDHHQNEAVTLDHWLRRPN